MEVMCVYIGLVHIVVEQIQIWIYKAVILQLKINFQKLYRYVKDKYETEISPGLFLKSILHRKSCMIFYFFKVRYAIYFYSIENTHCKQWQINMNESWGIIESWATDQA